MLNIIIRNFPDPLDKIAKLLGVYFDWIPEKGGNHSVGFYYRGSSFSFQSLKTGL